MSLKSCIKQNLEMVFDMPFIVDVNYAQQEPAFKVAPDNSNDRLFNIHGVFRNKTRLDITFEPQQFAVQMVREMSTADEQKRRVFCAYASQLLDLKAKFNLRINDVQVDPKDYNSWPEKWHKFSFKISVWPIEYNENDTPNYIGTTDKWLPIAMGMSLSLLNVVKKDDDEEPQGATEGKRFDVVTNRYERNPLNRVLCLAKYGYTCQICGFDFEKTYGELGHEFIHVHHIIPVSQMGENYNVNPIEDLIPVCPNCHAMLHRENPPIPPERLKELVKRNNNQG